MNRQLPTHQICKRCLLEKRDVYWPSGWEWDWCWSRALAFGKNTHVYQSSSLWQQFPETKDTWSKKVSGSDRMLYPLIHNKESGIWVGKWHPPADRSGWHASSSALCPSGVTDLDSLAPVFSTGQGTTWLSHRWNSASCSDLIFSPLRFSPGFLKDLLLSRTPSSYLASSNTPSAGHASFYGCALLPHRTLPEHHDLYAA